MDKNSDKGELERAISAFDLHPVAIFANTADLAWQEMIVSDYQLVGHWLYSRRIDSSHRIPFKRSEIKLLEPLCKLALSELDALIQVHAFGEVSIVKNYSSASEWFRLIVLEQFTGEFSLPVSGRGSKDAILRMNAQTRKSLGGLNNPYSPREGINSWRFIEAATSLAGKSNEFRKNFWHPYLKALKTWDEHRKLPAFESHYFTEGGDLRAQIGKGKGSRLIQKNLSSRTVAVQSF